MTYSGPTYIAIRSGKHSSSTAFTHAQDIHQLLNLKEFESLCKTINGEIKPICIITVDGGPDESPRNLKVIRNCIGHFLNYDLDGLYVATNAPGRSAYNRVERRMAPLSHGLAGVVLQHDHFGSHLNSSGKTIDEDLEKRNFKHAGEILCQIWNELQIDNHPVVATYVDPDEENFDQIKEVSAAWYQRHVRESQYFLQIVKCDNLSCCRPHRSSIRNFIPDGFIPPPLKIEQSDDGLKIAKASDTDAKFMPLFVQLSMKNIDTGFIKVKVISTFYTRYLHY